MRKKLPIFVGIFFLIALIGTGIACDLESTAPEPQSGGADIQILTHNLDCEAPPDIQILNHNLNCETHEWSDYCDCSITGTVKNVGDGDAEGLSVEAEFFDAHGIRIDESSDYIGELSAGQSAYFDIFYYETQCPNNYDIWTEDWYDYCDCHLTGTVKNVGDGDAGLVSVEAEFFDAQGWKIDEGWDYIGDLGTGQSATFDITYWLNEECPATFEVWTEWMDY